ncbi:MAG TPA: hypothetical protein VLA33_01045 [Gemmatimonadota bacterium]|nr:hypothetical protein [Gemmatimonadota bacterium]
MQHLRAIAALLLTASLATCSTDASAGAGDSDADADLRARAAELLPEVERLSGLPAREALRLGIRSRADLEAFLEAELEEQFAGERMGNVVRAYARFGLVPDTLDLEPLLSRLLLEQVAGFYDPKSDTLFVVEGISQELVDGVLVHEMVHALQDQYVDLDSLVEATRQRNDPGMAVQAAVEGHATFVMYEWMLGQMTGGSVDLSRMPRLSESLDSEALASAGIEMPELQQAPAVIREQLLFPYVSGLDFIQVRWAGADGRVPPLGDALPVTTEQILHPERWGAPELVPPAPLEFATAASGEWSEVYSDGLGEIDTRILLREFLTDRDRADAAAAGWDGDIYRLLEGPSGEVLVWVSRWDTRSEATEFARAMERVLAARYPGESGRRVAVERPGDRIVRVVDLPSAGESPPDALLSIDAEE